MAETKSLGKTVGGTVGSAVVQGLAQSASGLLKARGDQLAQNLGGRLSGLTDRLEEFADSGGKTSLVGEGLKRKLQGQSTTKAALGALGGKVGETVKGAVGGRSKKGGGQPKMMNIIEDIDVGVPASVAYNQWTQFSKFSDFMKGVEGVDQEDEATTNWRVKVFKSNRSWKAKTGEQIPDRRISWTSEGAKGTTKGVVTFHPLADDLTKVLLVLEYYPSGFFEKTGNLWRAGGRRARLDLKHFRRYITIQGEAEEGWRGEIRDNEVVRQPDEDGQPEPRERQLRYLRQPDEEEREPEEEREGAVAEDEGEGYDEEESPEEEGEEAYDEEEPAKGAYEDEGEEAYDEESGEEAYDEEEAAYDEEEPAESSPRQRTGARR